MIRGQNIENLTIIRDTTAGRVSVWMMVVMLFLLYMLYLLVLYRMEMIRIDECSRLKQSLERELAAAGRKPVAIPEKKDRGVNTAGQIAADAEDRAAMEFFNDLKHRHRRW